MSQSTRTIMNALRRCLLALAISVIAVGCSHEDHADADVHLQADAHAGTHAKASESAHGIADHASDEHAAADHAAHAANSPLPSPPAKRWASDAPLREGMRRMHRAVEALDQGKHGHLDLAQTSAIAQQVQDAANDMFANCKLTPEPDVALHGVLATLMGGAAAIKAKPTDLSPVASMRDAVALYPRLFEDATWQADTAPPE